MKSEAMDAAISAGVAAPNDAVTYVKDNFGLEISAKQFSTHKSLIKQKASIDARLPRPRVAPVIHDAVPSAAPPPVPAREVTTRRGSPPEIADAVQAIKGLVDILGVEQVKRIAGLFAS